MVAYLYLLHINIDAIRVIKSRVDKTSISTNTTRPSDNLV